MKSTHKINVYRRVMWRTGFALAVVAAAIFFPGRAAQAIFVNSLTNGTIAGTDVGTCVGSFVTVSYTVTGENVEFISQDSFIIRLVDAAGNIILSIADVSAIPGPLINTNITTFAIGGRVGETTDAIVPPTQRPFRWQLVESTSTGLPFSPAAGPVLAQSAPFDPVAAPHNIASCASVPFGNSGNLDSQQRALTPLIMNQFAYNLVSGVGGNLNGLFNGNGAQPQFAANGFFFQTTGLANWYDKRHREVVRRERRSYGNDPLSDPRAASDDIMALSGDAADQAGPSWQAMPWNGWIKGVWTYYDGKGSSFDGHIADVIGGVDRRISEDVIFGVLFGYGNTDFDTVTAGTAGSFKADGISGGGYIGVRLAEYLIFDGLIAYTRSDYDNKSGTTTGTFDADRVTAAAHLTGKIEGGGIVFEPIVAFMIAHEAQDAYTDSVGTRHGSNKVTAGRVSLGPKISVPTKTDSGTVTPWVSAKAEYDFSSDGPTSASGLPDIDDTISARISAGIVTAVDGVSIGVRGDVSGLGSGEYKAYGGTVKVDMPF